MLGLRLGLANDWSFCKALMERWRDDITCAGLDGSCALPVLFPHDIEVVDGDQASLFVGHQRVAGLVPVLVIFSIYDVKEIAFGKAEFLRVGRKGSIVIFGFDDLASKSDRVSGLLNQHA